jgi:ribosomal-protein-alanine N-acetyltransferase
MLPGDLDRVVEIERESFAHPWSADLLGRELVHAWSTILLACERRTGPDGIEPELVHGFIVYWLVHDELHILNIAVAPRSRRRGVARALLDEAEARGRAAGATLATLEVRKSNLAAIQLYRRRGYRQVSIRPNYYADEGEDAIVMLRDLGSS